MQQAHLLDQRALLRIHNDHSEFGRMSWVFLLIGPIVGATRTLNLSLKSNLLLGAGQIDHRSGEEGINF